MTAQEMAQHLTAPKVKRRGVFVDVQNIFFCIRDKFPNCRVNYQAIKDFFSTGDALTTFTAFSCVDPENREQRGFIMRVAFIGYRVVTKPLKRMFDGNIKANMDMEMALEILDQAPFLDEIVIISGDGDFVSLINRLVQMGKHVIVVGPDQFSAPELIQACHEFINFSRIPGALEEREEVEAEAVVLEVNQGTMDSAQEVFTLPSEEGTPEGPQ